MSIKKIEEEIKKFLRETTVKYSQHAGSFAIKSNSNRVQPKGLKPGLGSPNPDFTPLKKPKRKKKKKVKTKGRPLSKGGHNEA